MKIKKESDFGELLFRIIVLIILIISFKPIYLYFNSFKKAQINQVKPITIEQKVYPKTNFNQNQVSNNTYSQDAHNNKQLQIQIEKPLITKAINTKQKLMLPKKLVTSLKNNHNKLEEFDVLSVEQVNNYVEKINAYIDEQDYLLSNIDTESSSSGHVLKSIEKSIQDIENEIKDKKISNLINNTELNNLKLKIESYRQAIKQI
ncbi:MAG: hypothetical protein SZ59_C0001G0049 [candidate division TM6 bacterium GW2011_GWF2_28_16]|nr:MAG: hypothetical protein SZ59_C0001G0049 [candidate division TM6 bacterium GW2011_GWF2_28_16]